jgi:hypothetical protein
MKRLFATLLLSGWLASSLGCAMCNQCGDDCYTFYGGSVPRTDYCHGRVGSAFDSAGDVASYDEGYSETYSDDEIYEEQVEDQDLAIPIDALSPQGDESMTDDTSRNESFADTDEFAVSTEAEDDLPPARKTPKATSTPSRNKTPRLNQRNYLP